MEKPTIYTSAPKPPKQIRIDEEIAVAGPETQASPEQIQPETKEEQASVITVMRPVAPKDTVVKLNPEKQPELVFGENEEPVQAAESEVVLQADATEAVAPEADTVPVLDEVIDPEKTSAEEQEEIAAIDTMADVETEAATEPETLILGDEELASLEADTAQEVDLEPDAIVEENIETMAVSDLGAMTEQDIGEKISQEPAATAEPKTETEKPVKHHAHAKHKTDAEHEFENLKIPGDDELFQRQYYTMGEVATMFHANQSQIRFWENEFDILQPKKNKKGDRYFRPEDVKNLQVIHHLLRNRRFTIEGAREYLKSNKQRTQDTIAAIASLNQLKSFLSELKSNL